MEKYINKSYSSIHVLKWENYFQKDSADFSHRNLTLKIGFLQSLKGQKELEEVLIKKLFGYNKWMAPELIIWNQFFLFTNIELSCKNNIFYPLDLDTKGKGSSCKIGRFMSNLNSYLKGRGQAQFSSHNLALP